MNKQQIHKLMVARRQFDLAKGQFASENDLSLSIGVNLLQDAVETFLIVVCEHVNASVGNNTPFNQYLDLIDKKIAPKTLSFRTRLNALNKLRVNSKHYGLAPAKSECDGLILTVSEFFKDTSSDILGINIFTVSLLELLQDGDRKSILEEGMRAFHASQFVQVLIAARKALYLTFESRYNIAPFEDGAEILGLEKIACKAPYYARNPQYIKEFVLSPTDYIVYDNSDLELELMKNGVDSKSYWNLWRLTPQVWKRDYCSEWIVKDEFVKYDEDGIKERAQYVLDAVINMMLSVEEKNLSVKVLTQRKYVVKPLKSNAKVYKKADLSSEVVSFINEETSKMQVDYSVQGINSGEIFWHVNHWENGVSIDGFIRAEDVEE